MNPRSRPDCGYSYTRACPKDWRAAAQVWFGPSATPHQIDTYLQTTQHDETLARGWWVARRGDDVAAVQLVLSQPGALAVCWPPTCRAGQQHHFAPLWSAARQALCEQGVHLFQCLVPVNDLMSESLMAALGFQRITELITMRYRHDARRFEGGSGDSVKVTPVGATVEAAFEEALFETYADSRDAPEMDAFQRREDILAGYAAPPSSRWILSDEQGQYAGALVLTEQDHIGQLNYLGVVPRARRKGLARTVVSWTLSHFRSRDVGHVMVRLDARNEPALRLYERCGFLESHRDVLMVAR